MDTRSDAADSAWRSGVATDRSERSVTLYGRAGTARAQAGFAARACERAGHRSRGAAGRGVTARLYAAACVIAFALATRDQAASAARGPEDFHGAVTFDDVPVPGAI